MLSSVQPCLEAPRAHCIETGTPCFVAVEHVFSSAGHAMDWFLCWEYRCWGASLIKLCSAASWLRRVVASPVCSEIRIGHSRIASPTFELTGLVQATG